MPKKQLWEVIDEKKTADSTKDFEKMWKSQVPTYKESRPEFGVLLDPLSTHSFFKNK